MTPVDQTTFGDKDGNCFAACLASVLELPIEAVPNFMAHKNWWPKCLNWLHERHMGMLIVQADTCFGELHGCWIIAGGQSPRGDFGHAVVWRAGGVAHDPHPDRAGLRGAPEEFYLLVPHDPAALLRGVA